jgi:hypothetical protein
MNLTPQQRKFLWICIALAVAYYIVRLAANYAMQAAYYQQQAIRAAQQLAQARPAGAPASPANLSGIWQGKTAITGRGLCTLRIEIRPTDPTHFAGYSTLTCENLAPLMTPQERGNIAAAVLNQMNPASAILSGTVEKGSIRFHVDKTIGTNGNGCAATNFTLTPFGATQLAAEWQEATCQGGSVVLQRARS